MYFITKKTSTTGKKIKAVMDKANECLAAQKKLGKELGFNQWREAYWRFAGGISAVMFKETPDLQAWRQVTGNPKGEYIPRKNTKAGKELWKKIEALPTVTINAINECVNAKHIFPSHVGVSQNKTHWCIISDEKWDIDFPSDCKEITVSEKQKLFKK